ALTWPAGGRTFSTIPLAGPIDPSAKSLRDVGRGAQAAPAKKGGWTTRTDRPPRADRLASGRTRRNPPTPASLPAPLAFLRARGVVATLAGVQDVGATPRSRFSPRLGYNRLQHR